MMAAIVVLLGVALLYFSLPHSLVRGARTPRPAHSATPRAEDFLCCGRLV
jgi:hypothetical protein